MIMKKNLLLYILIAFLIVVNGFFLFTNFRKPHLNDQKGPRDFIVKALKFDENQKKSFELISEEHHQKMRTISKDIKSSKDDLLNRISNETIDVSEIDSLVVLIGKLEKNKEEELFYHVRAIREICDDNQKRQFMRIINDARRKDPNQRPGALQRKNPQIH